ncbi:MAG TPA: MMPL family transporter [Solirubrobacteraceae bacterium]|nr:MMPL family transporter [Solirubrobacteraceae bacterium]
MATVAAGVVGAGVVGSLSNGGNSDPSAPSVVAQRQIVAATGVPSDPAIVALVRTPGPVLGSQGRALVARVVREMRSPAPVARVLSVLDAPRPSLLISREGHATVVLGYIAARASDSAATAAAEHIKHDLDRLRGVTVGGSQLTFSQLDDAISSQLPKVELIAFSILLLLSLIAFRGLIAASLPLIVGAIAVAGSLLIMRALAQVTSLSVYSLNLVTGLGLGLAIDYSLFIVYRYREELARCGHCSEALERTLATAGRTVAFSSLTVAVALLSLLAFPQRMLSSMGIAAAIVTVFAATAALIPLSAILTLLGPRVNALSPAFLQRARTRTEGPPENGRWYRLAMAVMRRPALAALAAAACLLAAGLPALKLHLGSTDSRVLPPGTSARVVDATLATQFAANAANPVVVLVHAPARAATELAHYRAALARLPGVAAVLAPGRIAAGLWRVDLLASAPPLSASSQRLIGEIYAMRARYPVALTGVAAGQYDEHLSLRSHVALALPILAATTLLVLFMMTGSVVLAIKSLLMNLLTLCGAFGMLVFIFQDGRLQSLLGYTGTGSLEQTNMIILFIIAFGLSTDYGVFLLARIKESHDAGANDRVAVATGLERSGRVVSAAALLFCAAVGSLSVSSVASLKEFGAGAALAVIIDSTLVRAIMVPALMALLGRANWWAPSPLRLLAGRSWAHPTDVVRGRIAAEPPSAPARSGS